MKVLYWISTESHKRMCVSMQKCSDIEQAIVLPMSVSTSKLKLKIYKYSHPNLNEVVQIIDKFRPDAFVQYTSSRYFVNILKKRRIKHCFSAHGVWPDKSYNNRVIVADQFFQNFDLFLGANNGFKDTLKKYGKVNGQIVTDALTQFDILHNYKKKAKKIRNDIIKGSKKPNADKVITLFGHKLAKKTDNLAPYDYGYYKTTVELSKLAEKNNWLIFIKPKGDNDRLYIKESKKLAGIRNEYLKVNKVQFLKHNVDPYMYLFSDLIVTSARSTIEVEAALINKPILRIWEPKPEPNERQLSYEYGALDFNATSLVKDISKIEDLIISSFDSKKLIKAQNNLVQHHGITFDGKSHIRFLNAIRQIAGSRK